MNENIIKYVIETLNKSNEIDTCKYEKFITDFDPLDKTSLKFLEKLYDLLTLKEVSIKKIEIVSFNNNINNNKQLSGPELLIQNVMRIKRNITISDKEKNVFFLHFFKLNKNWLIAKVRIRIIQTSLVNIEKNLKIEIQKFKPNHSHFNIYKIGFLNNLEKKYKLIDIININNIGITTLEDLFIFNKNNLHDLDNLITLYEKIYNNDNTIDNSVNISDSLVNNIVYYQNYIYIAEIYLKVINSSGTDLALIINELISLLENKKYYINSDFKVDTRKVIIKENIVFLLNKALNYDNINTSLILQEMEIYERKASILTILNSILKENIYFNFNNNNNNNVISYLQELLLFNIDTLENKKGFNISYLLEHATFENLDFDLPMQNKLPYQELIYLNRTLSLFNTFKDSYVQEIIIGPVGSGKSNYVKEITKQYGNNNIYRTVFSPSFSREDFIGSVENGIFVPGIFTIFYTESLCDLVSKIINFFYEENLFENSVKSYLIIEEINRGYALDILDFCSNLLDRKNGFSSYPIHMSQYQKEYVSKHLSKKLEQLHSHSEEEFFDLLITIFPDLKDILSCEINEIFHDDENGKEYDQKRNINRYKIMANKITLLPNMNILCTMNHYDENIRSIDYMLFRRFSIKHMKSNSKHETIYIENLIEEDNYTWNNIIQVVNKKIRNMYSSEKQIAFYFLSGMDYVQINNKKKISEKAFRNKFLYFLYYKVLNKNDLDKMFNNFDFEELLELPLKQLYELISNINSKEKNTAILDNITGKK